MFRMSVSFTDPQHQRLAEEATRLGISIGELVRRITDEWRKTLEKGNFW
jgi:hypothetical protein